MNWFANYQSQLPKKEDPIKRPGGVYICSITHPQYPTIPGFRRIILEAAMSAREAFCTQSNLDQKTIEDLPIACNLVSRSNIILGERLTNVAPPEEKMVLSQEALEQPPYSVKMLMQIPAE